MFLLLLFLLDDLVGVDAVLLQQLNAGVTRYGDVIELGEENVPVEYLVHHRPGLLPCPLHRLLQGLVPENFREAAGIRVGLIRFDLCEVF